MKRIVALALGFAAISAANAFAQTNQNTAFPTQTPGVNAQGTVAMCLDWKGTAVPCSGISPLPVRIYGGNEVRPFPTGAVPITGNATGTTGAVVGTLPAQAGKITYICGFNVSAIGGTAAVGPITIANLVGGSAIYQMASLASGNTVAQQFSPCIPANAYATTITITTTADGTATAVSVNSWGFQL